MSERLREAVEKFIGEQYWQEQKGYVDLEPLRQALAAQPETNGEALSENVRKAFEGEFHVSVDQEYDGYVQVRVGTEFASDEQAEFVERAIRAALAATGGKRVSS